MKLSRLSLSRISAFVCACLFSGLSVAAPSVWWDHFEAKPSESQADCVRRASSLIATEKTRHVTVDSDSVRIWSEKSVGVVECIQFGEMLTTAILVTSEDNQEGEHLFRLIREGLRSQPPKPS